MRQLPKANVISETKPMRMSNNWAIAAAMENAAHIAKYTKAKMAVGASAAPCARAPRANFP